MFLDPVGDVDDRLDWGFGDDAVAEVEDVAGTAVGGSEDFFDAGFEDGFGGEEANGVEVALHRCAVTDRAPALVERDAPI